jgi:hypothetical protein
MPLEPQVLLGSHRKIIMTKSKTTKSTLVTHTAKAGNASANAAKRTRELTSASSRVIAKRTALGAAAMINPAAADIGEFSKLVPEKAKAASAATNIFLKRSMTMGNHVARISADEIGFISDAAGKLAACRSPQSAFAVQSAFALAWMGRAVSHSLSATDFIVRSGTAVLYPYHRAATGNAQRLGV